LPVCAPAASNVGEVERYENGYQLYYILGTVGIIAALAESISFGTRCSL